jgi:membrane protein insertase Oxa1/YidC/SpoIIIJ
MRASLPVFTRRALAIVLTLSVFTPITLVNQAVVTSSAEAKTRKPSIAEINEAKKKEAEKKAAADRAKAKLNAASNQLKVLTAKAVISKRSRN